MIRVTKFLVAGLLVCVYGILIASFVCAASNYSIDFNQYGKKAVVNITIQNSEDQPVLLKLPNDATEVLCEPNCVHEGEYLKSGAGEIKASYITNQLIESSGDNYYFVKNFIPEINSENLNIRLILDEGFNVKSEEIFPDAKTETDGMRIAIVWEFQNINYGQSLPLFVKFRSISESLIWLYAIISFFVVVVIIIFIKVYFKKANKNITNKQENENYEKYLFESEKRVIEELKKAQKNEMWQRQLQLNTGFSKAKLSRVIRNLETRDLIKKIPFGNTNKIRLN